MALGVTSAAADPPAPSGSAQASATTSAAAKKVSAADRDAARAFAEQGFEKFQQNKFSEAIVLFSKAEEHFHAPTHVAFIAKSHEKRGELIEAAEEYRKVIAETLPKDAPQPFRDAQAEAGPALEAVVRRTPKLRVDVHGTGAEGAQILAGDRAVVAGASSIWNPGTVVVRVTAEGVAPLERTVILPETGTEVVVRFDLARSMSIAWPLLALGLGVAVGGVSAGLGVVSHDKEVAAKRICSDVLVCPDAQLQQITKGLADANQLRNVSIGTAIAGGVFIAAGVTLFILRPRPGSSVDPASAAGESARVAPASIAVRAGPSFIGISGAF